MDEVGFTYTGKQIEQEVEAHQRAAWVYRHTSSRDGAISVRTGEKITKGSPLFLDASLFSVEDFDAAMIYKEYLKVRLGERDWYDDLSYDPERKKSNLGKVTALARLP